MPILAACQTTVAPSSTGAPVATAAPAVTAAASGTAQPGAAATESPNPGGQATIALFGSPGTSLLANFTNTGYAVTIDQCVFGSLLKYNFPKVEIQPNLAESYEVSSDGTTYTFHLRNGVKWSDGQPFTAHDVEATVLAMTDPSTLTNWISYVAEIQGATDRKQGQRSDVPGLQVVDDTTLRATTVSPSAVFLDLFGTNFMVLPKHILDTIPMDQLLKSSFAQLPDVSTGPFHIVQYVPGQFVELDRNPNYWGTPAYLDKVFVKITDTDTGMVGLQRGEIDIVGDSVPAANVSSLKSDPDVAVTSYPFDTCLTLYPNLHTAFGDVRVRQAMMYGIDRESIVQSVLQGYGKVAYSVYSELSPYYNASVINQYPFDPDKAKQLLQAANWSPSGQLRFYVGAGDKVVAQTATVIQQQLAAIGIVATIQTEDFSTFVDRLIKSHDFDLAIGGNVGFQNLDLTRRFACNMLNGGVNGGGYCNPNLDALMNQARATVNLTDQKPLTDQIQQIINTEVATVPLYYADNIGAVNTKRIGGAVPHFGGVHRDVATWYARA
jgi:peptide/nickel transport system substrate-binding protein